MGYVIKIRKGRDETKEMKQSEKEIGIKDGNKDYNDIEEIIIEGEEELLNSSLHSKSVYPMKQLKIDKTFYTIFELKRKFDKQPPIIILDSDFQRKDVWKMQQKRELIESVLMGLPLPIFYFNEDKKGRLVVIDGRQRLTALFEYIGNKFELKNLKIMSQYNGKKFQDLDPIMKTKIEDYQIFSYIIQPPTPDTVKFDIFDRVNRGGTQLNKQEIRNALYQGNATRMLERLSKTESFENVTEKVFKRDTRMKDKYIISRFIAYYLYFNNKLKITIKEKEENYHYQGDIDELLGITMEYLNRIEEKESLEIEETIIRSFEQSIFYLGINAFRLVEMKGEKVIKRYPININIFEIVSYGMTKLPYQEEGLREKIKISIQNLKESSEFQKTLRTSRDNISNVEKRYSMMMEIVEEVNLL